MNAKEKLIDEGIINDDDKFNKIENEIKCLKITNDDFDNKNDKNEINISKITNNKNAKSFTETLKKTYFKLIIIGQGLSGKTWYFRHRILPEIRDEYTQLIIFTNPSNSAFKTIFYPCTLIMTDHLKRLKMILDRISETFVYDKKGNKLMNGDDYLRPENILMVFDDILSEKMITDEIFTNFICYGRHSGISMLFMVQYPKIILSPLMRSQNTHLGIFKMKDKIGMNAVIKMIEDSLITKNYESDKARLKAAQNIYIDCILKKKYGKVLIDNSTDRIYSE